MKTARTEDAMTKEVAAIFDGYPPTLRAKLARLRKLILATAAKMDGIGAIQETLRWGQPAFLSKSGSTIRIDAVKGEPSRYALYFICHTDLVARFRELYPQLIFDGNRAILLDARAALPEDALRHCISMALSYRRRAKLERGTPADS
jgi:hypothetical protein